MVTLLTADVAHTDSEVVYEENKLELHRYDPGERAHGTPILIVYALVNRPYILDLQPDRSVIRRLLDAGFEVYLIRWGNPSRLDTSLGLADYVCRYLDNCADAVCEEAGVEDIHLLGYCMGGTMSIMYTALFEERVRTLGLMATPIAFEGTGGVLERWATHYDPEVAVETYGNLPAELLAVGFSMMEPVENYVTKYIRLYENIENEAFVENFARMEQWIWDGVDLAGEAYREFVTEVYKQNQLVEDAVALDGQRVVLGDIEVPVLQIVGQYDHIVPAASSTPFNDLVGSEDERLIEFPAGHVGISVSSTAHDRLWPDVCEWYGDRSESLEERGETAPGTDDDKPSMDGTAGNGEAPVETVRGVGPTYADRLAAAGIETVGDLREHDPKLLAAITDTSPVRAETWLNGTDRD
ncbi:MAG: class III poly(R)-hydroxyalkanoic acid synthase subunit PhaC [Halobacteriales archaeon SW_8_66_22]|nr:MAG: class III poly(R)-hydroxyalkanoic acid synthase subunit PhaC [Halobacteriales archaeon SW_8_66_22]